MSAHVPIVQGSIRSVSTFNLSGFVQVKRHPVESVVAEQFGVEPQMMHSRDRHETIATARAVTMALMIEYGMHPTCVSNHFGRHRTVSNYHLKQFRNRYETDAAFRTKVNASRAALGI